MKAILKFNIALPIILFSSHINAQTIQRLKDPHIVGQEKRQVFQQWGDWRPNPKYFLGIQTNLAYATVWGWIAPQRNRDYRNGADIRPLSPAGLQNQRYASTLLEEKETEKVLEEIKSVYSHAIDEQLHYSSATVPTDPLYLLYYKPMLKDLQEFNTDSPIPLQWGFTSTAAFESFQRLGMMGEIKRKLDVLQDRLELAKSMEIPRGKRIMMFHECLIEWRKNKKYLAYLNQQGLNRIKAEGRLTEIKERTKNGNHSQANRDAEIFVDTYLRLGQ